MIPNWQYLLHSVVWLAGGFVLGVLYTRSSQDVHRIANAVEGAVQTVPRRRWRPSYQVVLGVVVLVLTMYTTVTTWRLSECQLAYANRFADALDARTVATGEAQQALDELMATVGQLMTGGASPQARESFRAALHEYLTKRDSAKRKQAEHPFPPAPRDLCR
ncbi:hypothetical protein ACFXGA_06075 [Actinosynnema sp. NPDC059335]|uniref:hypothetical protein n=1 Tax=Actinosynnema sp. NPDC059335 TaxID=3346804 RepID=UPI00366F56A7